MHIHALKRTFVLLAFGLFSLTAFAADESCTTCSNKVTVTGDFKHDHVRARPPAMEDINGPAFTVTVASLPEGTYTVNVLLRQTPADKAGENVFDLSAGTTVLATGFDVATAPGTGGFATLSAKVEKSDDALRGPLQLTFSAKTGRARFNKISILDAQNTEVVSFAASNLADAFSAAALVVPEVKTPAIWQDPTKPAQKRLDDLISRMSLAEKVSQLKNAAPAIPRLGLKAYDYWNEALHGVANNDVATVFPQSIGAASSWNPELFKKEGTIIGIEGRAKFNDYANRNNGDSKWWTGLTFWTPNINIFRDPRWGRGQETFGEDPYLTSEMGIAFVQGIQGDDPKHYLALACAKHFAVHSGPERDRHSFDARISNKDLYDTYLPQFERVVREGKVAGVMSAYNRINGIPASADANLLTKILRKDWGFDGYVVSDCDAIRDIHGKKQHAYVETPEEAAALAVKAGCNLCCGGDYDALVRAVQQGLVTEAEINQALARTLETRLRLGLFDPAESVPFNKYTLKDNDLPEHGQIALEVARESIVLLKNDGILPLDRNKIKRLAVIGPNADSRSMLEGNYHGTSSTPVSILSGIKHIVGKEVKVDTAMGSPITTKPGQAPWSGQDNTTKRPVDELKAEALKIAAEADVIVYVGGITPAQEGESFDRESIELPAEQTALIRELHALGKPMVMVNCSGSAMALTWEDENLSAVVQAWYPGQNGGRAVAEVLFGIVNPSGHLPVTFYRATSDLPDFKDYSMQNRTYRYFRGKALYPFGHGLSYSTFEYSDFKVKAGKGGALVAQVKVTNTGKHDGADVVQLYATTPGQTAESEIKSLCAFTRVTLRAGESRTLTVPIKPIALRRWDEAKNGYALPRGNWTFSVGESSADIRQSVQLKL